MMWYESSDNDPHTVVYDGAAVIDRGDNANMIVDTWYQLGAVLTSGANDTLAQFTNGVAIGVDTVAMGDTTSTHVLDIGDSNDTASYGKPVDGRLDELRISNVARSDNWMLTNYETQNDPGGFNTWGAEETQATGSNIYYYDGATNIEYQRDDSSPVQMWNGVAVIGLKLGNTNDANASPAHVWDGVSIKAILKMP